MKRLPLLIVLLVLAHVLASLVVWTQMDFKVPIPGWRIWFEVALSISQIGLMAVWLCFGRTGFLIRLVMTALVMWTWVLAYSHAESESMPWPLLMMAIASSVVLILFGLRWFGLAISDLGERERVGQDAFQFSIWQLLVWMTVVAISLGLLKATGPRSASANDLVVIVALGILLAPVAMSSLWLALGQGRLGWRIVVAILYPLLAAAAFGLVADNNPLNEVGHRIAMLTTILCLLSLFVVQQSGYRLVWLRWGLEEEAADVHPLDVGDRDTADAGEETAL